MSTHTALEWIKDIHNKASREHALALCSQIPESALNKLYSSFSDAMVFTSFKFEGEYDDWDFLHNLPYKLKLTSEIQAEWEREYKYHFDFFSWLNVINTGEDFANYMEIMMEQVRIYLNQKHGIEHVPQK
jgi:hypothetical protein